MLRFKQFLILEDTTISPREHLEAVYGKEKAAEMIDAIREREIEKGSAEDFGHATRAIGNEANTGFNAINPFLDMNKLADKVYSRFNIDSDTAKTANRFAIPIYSDDNLDKQIPVRSADLSGYEGGDRAADSLSAGLKNREPLIRVNNKGDYARTDPLLKWVNDPNSRNDKWYSRAYAGNADGDILGHEATHAVQPNFKYNIKPDKLEKTKYGSDEPASPERLKRREYTQNAFEPAARMSEIKHMYFKQTNKLLKANMTPEEKEALKTWYNNPDSGVKDDDFDDTMQLIDTPEGDELFRRTAKVNKPSTSDTRMT